MVGEAGLRPNVLLLMTDQQRWDSLGCVGGWVDTPNLDRIASRGVRFSHCVTTSPICVPARVSLATGHYPHNFGVWGHVDYTLDPTTPTWMQAVRDAGYRTSVFGKTHLHAHVGDLREKEHLLHAYGLDDVDEIAGPRLSATVMSHMTARWAELGLLDAYRADVEDRMTTKPWVVRPSPLPLEEYADVYVGRRAREYLAGCQRDEPWFCWVSFGGPHEPWDTPEPWASHHDPEAMPPPLPPLKRGDPWPDGSLDRWLAWLGQPFTPEEIQRMRADYAGNVSLIDDQIGGILRTIEERGELNRTVIVFTSDHGEMNGDHGLMYKMNFFDGSVRVPLIVSTPAVASSPAAGTTDATPVEWIDVGPTIVEAVGAELSHHQFGTSLLPALEGQRVREDALSEFEGEFMLLTDDWKLALNDRGEPYLLFDRHADPDEAENLVLDGATSSVRTDLRLRMLDRLVTAQVQHR
ncbi:sulfatase [Candidatus Poriferisocius sp.]|uniref:sulfatase family protein n=1 Tax=Candidatus Poriferisocius sp. TaxID=3101276 RepID=UPI003B5B91EE